MGKPLLCQQVLYSFTPISRVEWREMTYEYTPLPHKRDEGNHYTVEQQLAEA